MTFTNAIYIETIFGIASNKDNILINIVKSRRKNSSSQSRVTGQAKNGL